MNVMSTGMCATMTVCININMLIELIYRLCQSSGNFIDGMNA